MKKAKYFLLVDDSVSTNFFNKAILQKTECVEKVLLARNGKEALDYIKSGITPEVIFLDINMPIMDGWEFLEEFERLDKKLKKSVIILMIGAELSREDREKAEKIKEVKEFQEKMLTKEIVCKIVKKYFNEATSEVCKQLDNVIA
ncbi:response regulator [Aquimarina aquimarini]|uniref:response regulator n=1 Tax=Aquimarina aquimarini TaxID=1191734 RepID=UPI000D561A09|nr:response regulator [Aquimarina aquimarini]